MSRITMGKLMSRVELLNTVLNRPIRPYTQDEKGRNIPNTGCFMLDAANGGYQLECMSEGGGVWIVIHRCTAKELNMAIEGMLMGIRIAKEQFLPPF